jgi:putative tricarboxylic transport membrane protein
LRPGAVTGDPAAEPERHRSVSAGALAAAIVALGSFVAYEALTGADNPGYATVGPGAFPMVVGAALVIVGIALLLQAIRNQWHALWFEPVPSAAPSRESGNERDRVSSLTNVLLVATALVLDVVLIPLLGFVIASALMFTLVARAFGSPRLLLDIAVGLALAGAIHLVFVHGLGLHLPVGELWGSLPWRS